ncbi:hypothetical protein LDVICp039 [lymphocystis disease virus-China]|uniref:Uncharacterized protein n=2 Tax=Lymphocystis disease virus 2 TaxID=159183 RepID=A0A6F8X379_9VIRU|nr:hypothetical protein LDVICp039 [lymphocystis disease virus-China]AAU10886.1 hypothetical protein [lymphocystis disease virus-China]BCB67433.1 hypothetical protein [Lymphocystis disease virus 2]
MDQWKNLIETFNHPAVRRKYPLVNALKSEVNKLDESEIIKEIIELKKFIIENQPFPPNVFKKPYFKSQTGIILYFPNIFTFHPDKSILIKTVEELVSKLFPDGIPSTIERHNYVIDLLTEVDNIVKENDSVKNVQSVYELFENNKIKSLTQKIKTDLKEGCLKPNDLIDDLIIILEPMLEGESAEKELLRLIYDILVKLKNKEELNLSFIAPIIYKFQNLLTL